MFERFSDQARRVVVLAQEEARLLQHGYIGTEHLMLGLLASQGIAATALAELGVTPAVAREQVVEIIPPGVEPTSGHIPFTPRAKKVLEYGLREALVMGDTHIGSEHLLLGLLHEGDGVGAQILERTGIDAARAREAVMRARAAEPSAEPPPEGVQRERLLAARASFMDPQVEGMLLGIDLLEDDLLAAVLAARGEARRRGRGQLGLVELLVGLAEAPGPAGAVLAGAGATPDVVRELLEANLELGDASEGRPTLSPAACRLLVDAANTVRPTAPGTLPSADGPAALHLLLTRLDDRATALLTGAGIDVPALLVAAAQPPPEPGATA